MTVAVDVETGIGRPPAEVFKALSAVERYPEWLIASGITKVERFEASPLETGSRLRISQAVAGRSTVLYGEVTLLEPGSGLVIRARDPEGVTIELDARLESGDGLTTRLKWSVRMGLPLKYRMFESMVSPQAKRAAALDLEALKRRLESVAGR